MNAVDVHEQLERLRREQAPMPLQPGQAVAQARRLRERHMLSYRALSRVMGVYHGDWRSGETWRQVLRRAGVPRRREPGPHMFGYQEPAT